VKNVSDRNADSFEDVSVPVDGSRSTDSPYSASEANKDVILYESAHKMFSRMDEQLIFLLVTLMRDKEESRNLPLE
jgi:hypothetical protein